GLDQYYFHLSHTLFTDWRTPGLPTPEPDWFPGALASLPAIPYEVPFFLLLFAVGTLLIHRLAKSPRFPLPRTAALIFWGLILLQTWLHLSLRSPYTYIPH